MAGETIGTAYVEVRPKTEGFAQETQSKIAAPLQAAFGGIATGLAASKIKDFFSGAISGAQESAKVMAQTEAVLKSTGGAAGLTANHIEDLAGRLSELAAVDDEVIQQGENVLLTFTNIRNEAGKGNDVFDQAAEAALNLSVALGTDMQGAVIQVGKALNDPIAGVTALSRVGVSFTEQQKEQIKVLVESNDTLGAQKIILKELNKEFGGAAASQATDAAKLKLAFDNLQEAVGTALLPVINALAKALTPLAKAMSENQIAATAFAVVISGAVVAALAAYTIRMGQATLATFGFGTAQATANVAVQTTATSGLLVADSWGKVTPAITDAGTAAANSGTKFQQLKQGATEGAKSLSVWLIPLAAAVVLGKVLQDTFIASKPVFSETTANFQKMSDAQLKNSVRFQILEATAGTFRNTIKQLGGEAPETARRLLEAAELPQPAHDRLAKVIDRQEAAMRRQAAAAGLDATALADTGTEAERLDRAIRGVNDAMDGYVSRSFDSQGAAISMDRAIEALNVTIYQGTQNTLDGREALLRAEQSVVSFGQKIYDEKAALGDSRQALLDQIASLEGVRNTLDPGSPLAQFLDAYINNLRNGIPKDVHTDINATTEQQKVDAYLATLNAIAYQPDIWTNLHVNFPNATGYNFDGSLDFDNNPLTPFKTGGVVPGPIGKPLPILAHGGEEVLTYEERQQRRTSTNPSGSSSTGGDVHFHFEHLPSDAVGMARLTARTLSTLQWQYA